MVDPFTAAAANEVAKAGGGVLSRLLGPTADVMGAQLHEWYTRKNVERVAKRAEAKANTASNGAVPSRVAAEVFSKAQWADDEFVAEYLSGVLATARTPDGKDDRAVTWTALVGRLSADQLRLHYVLYRAIRELGLNVEHDAIVEILARPLVFAFTDLLAVMDIPASHEGAVRLLDAVYGLQAEGLIADDLAHGEPEYLEKIRRGHTFPKAYGNLLIVAGTTRGAALFLQAHGLGQLWAGAIVRPELDLSIEWPEGQGVPPVTTATLSDYRKLAPGPDTALG
ncbi:hypothetical protein [Agromyces sp. C10]|uniref:hypothetical protein n=1 Tax=Agromyces sp. C10 TaxID=2935077 RepID=UPI00200ACC03|nr:hypothetical protein [Agromyces sp. C10]MCK8608883.1 hypothetical protein [Agromyces sp. C10]